MAACDDRTRSLLTTIYTRKLLEKPPVRSLQEGFPGREELALRLARKDVNRLLEACEEGRWELALRRQAPRLLDLDEEAALEEEVAL